MTSGIGRYVATWRSRGYADGIPDEVPDVLMRELLAPSFKAIALAILKNDHALVGLGFMERPPTPGLRAYLDDPSEQRWLPGFRPRTDAPGVSISFVHMRARGAELLEYL